MARRKTRTLTELELQIMTVLWRQEECSVEQLRDALADAGRELALPSIRTMLTILQDKGYVTRRAAGRGHAYRAKVSEEKAQKSILRDIVDRAFDGSAAGLVAALVKGRMVAKRDLDKIKKLIREHEKGADDERS